MSSTGSCNETDTSIDQKQKFCYQILVFNLSAEESVSKHTNFDGLSKSLKVCFYGVFLVNSPISAQRCILCRNQIFDLYYKSSDWFLYEMQHWAEVG